MAKAEYYVGVDLGTTKVLCVVAQAQPAGELRVVALGRAPSRGMEKGMITDIEQVAESIREAVHKAEQVAGLRIHSAVVGVTGSHIECRNKPASISVTSDDYTITQDDVDRVMDQVRQFALPPDREVLHIIPREFSIDGQTGIKRPVGMSGKSLSVQAHVVTGAVTALTNVRRALERARLGVDDLILEPVATAESVLNEEEKQIGVAIIDIGGGTTDVAVFYQGAIVHTGVIPVGGNHFTRDIQIGLQTSAEEAQRVKHEHGRAEMQKVPPEATFDVLPVSGGRPRQVQTQKLAYIIEARATELLRLALREVHKSGVLQMLSAGLVFTGGGAQLRGLQALASRLYDPIPVRVGLPRQLASYAPELLKDPSAATGLGLVMYARRNQGDLPLDTTSPKSFWKTLAAKLRNWLLPAPEA